MFVALLESDNSRVEAVDAIRKLLYICPRCFERVILHKGKKRRTHFKHGKNSDCPYGQGESLQHEQAKAAIVAGVRVRGAIAEPEQEVLSIDGDRRADVIAFAPPNEATKDKSKLRRAFEVQYSAISSDDLMTRTNAYMAVGLPVLWIAVIDHEKFKNIYSVEGTNFVCVSGYSAPSWVEDIARLHRRLWIYVPQTNGFWRAWLLPHWCYKNPTDPYFDSAGEHHSGSNGYWYQAAKKRELYLEGPYPFTALRIVAGNHSDNSAVAPKGEKRWLVELLPYGIETALSPPIEQRRCPHFHNGRDTGSYNYVDWVTANGSDFKAVFSSLSKLTSLQNDV
jgi:Competence protein CoiA-like family